jgi:hypothetical protein
VDDIGRGILLIRPPQLSSNPASSYVVAKREERAKEMINFSLRSISFVL